MFLGTQCIYTQACGHFHKGWASLCLWIVSLLYVNSAGGLLSLSSSKITPYGDIFLLPLYNAFWFLLGGFYQTRHGSYSQGNSGNVKVPGCKS